MDQNFSSTKLPTAASSSSVSGAPAWSNPSRITADDASSAAWAASANAQLSLITGTTFAFQQLPDSAVIDGIELYIDGSQTGCYGNISINPSGTTTKAIGAMNGSYGGATDLWGATSISKASIAALSVSIQANDISGGDAVAAIDYISLTVYWHIELPNVEADVPTRIAYKVYSRDDNFLGELPNVTSKFGFSQDINSAGASMVITCGQYGDNPVTVEPLLTEAGDPILTESDLPILTTSTEMMVTTGASLDEAIFKNSNRIKIWLYNQYYPNGKLMFSGQVNRIEMKYGGGDANVKLTVYSDGLDLSNFIARGYPFNYTTDVSYTTPTGFYETYFTDTVGGALFNGSGQSFTTGVGVTNIGAISIKLRATANITVSVFDAPGGNLLGTTTRAIADGSQTVEQFEFAQLIEVTPSTTYFFTVSAGPGQFGYLVYDTPGTYAGGTWYQNNYIQNEWQAAVGDLYFITKSGLPTTTTTYSSDDPVTDMAHGILLDYNLRGGYITERDFTATGLSLTYTFVVATIFDALKKILELSPTGFYSYIDLGTAEIDIKQISTTPDFTIVRGRHINELNLALSIEQVKNYLLLSGGEVTPGVNLFRQYQDTESVSNYGLRTGTKSDNRITLDATADAIGDTFVEENADEVQETTVTVLNNNIDLTLLTPGKTIGFRNFGNFIDDMTLQIVRREPNFSDGIANLTLGRLPVRMNDEVQRINRELLNEQTINNPDQPS